MIGLGGGEERAGEDASGLDLGHQEGAGAMCRDGVWGSGGEPGRETQEFFPSPSEWTIILIK